MVRKKLVAATIFLGILVVILFTSLIYGFGQGKAQGPYQAGNTDSWLWYKMSPQSIFYIGKPMLYDVFFSGLTVSRPWIQLAVYSDAGVTEAWATLGEYVAPSLSYTDTDTGRIRKISTVLICGTIGGRRIILDVPADIEGPFTVFAKNSGSTLFATTIYPEDIGGYDIYSASK